MVHSHAVLNANGKGIARQIAEVGGVFVNAAYPARSKHGVICIQSVKATVFKIFGNNAVALLVIANYIKHSDERHDKNIFSRPRGLHKFGGNFLARAILVEANTGEFMPAFLGVRKRTVRVSRKIYAERD
jgi:hypothetical protein